MHEFLTPDRELVTDQSKGTTKVLPGEPVRLLRLSQEQKWLRHFITESPLSMGNSSQSLVTGRGVKPKSCMELWGVGEDRVWTSVKQSCSHQAEPALETGHMGCKEQIHRT